MFFLHSIIAWAEASKYFLLFFGSIFEGPIVMLSSGFLYRVGQFSFLPMYVALLAGDFVADLVWYCVGYYGASTIVKKYGSFFNITPEVMQKVEARFKTYQNSILIISKLTMGFGFAIATLVVAGMTKVPFRKYIALNFFGGFIWTLIMIGIGYFFGNVYLLIPDSLKAAFVIFDLVIVVIALHFINRYLVSIKI